MKYLLMLAVASALALPLMGCHASGDVDTDDGARHVETKKTTTVQPDGDSKTQISVEKRD